MTPEQQGSHPLQPMDASPSEGGHTATFSERIEEAIRLCPTKGTTYAPRYSTFGRALSKNAIEALAKNIARAMHEGQS